MWLILAFSLKWWNEVLADIIFQNRFLGWNNDGMYRKLGVYLFIIAVLIKRSTQLDHMRNAIDLTAKNFDDEFKDKHKFVLFYQSG